MVQAMQLRLSCSRAAGPALAQQPRPIAAVPCRRPARRRISGLLLLASAASVPAPDNSSSSGSSIEASQPQTNGAGAEAATTAAAGGTAAAGTAPSGGFWGWLQAQRQKSAELRKRLATLGLAAVLAYGLFDGVSYTIAFSLAFLGYEARTGLNPTQNVADIVKICILMWAGNNVTRPFRLAGAAALAPFMDRLMERMQAKLRLKSKATAFAILVAAVAGTCFAILGALFFSRWVRG